MSLLYDDSLSYDDSLRAAPSGSPVESALPVVLVHAFPVHRGLWMGVHASLAAGFGAGAGAGAGGGVAGPALRLLTPDLPGFGESPRSPVAPSLDAYVDALVDLLDALSLERVVLGGVSMGGYVSLAFASRHPERLLGLVLADTKASADPVAALDNRLRIAALLESEGTPRVLLEESLPQLLGATTKADRPHVEDAVRVMVAGVDPLAAAWAQRAMAARVDTFEVLRSLAVPVTVIVGDEDGITPMSDAAAMVATSPGATLTVIRGAGHLSAIENPVAFAAALTAFAATL